MKYYAGIDVGGTKIYTVVMNEAGGILGRAKRKIGHAPAFAEGLQLILESYRLACQDAEIEPARVAAVGLTFPSPVDLERKVIQHAPNLGWQNIAYAAPLKEAFQMPLFVDNDANLGIFGEYHLGAGKGSKNLYGLFIGTGIGGGYVFNGEVVRGPRYTCGEIGHMIIKLGGPRCNCGKRGCLEAFAGKAGMLKYMQRLVDEQGEKTTLDKLDAKWRTSVGSSTLRKAYQLGDPVVVKALHRAARAIGVAAANLVNVVGMDAILFGGGVMEALSDVLLPLIEKTMLKYAMAGGAEGVPLLRSTLGDDAIAMGAAWFVHLPEKQNFLF